MTKSGCLLLSAAFFAAFVIRFVITQSMESSWIWLAACTLELIFVLILHRQEQGNE